MKKSSGIPLLIIAAILPLVAWFNIEMIEFNKYPWFPNQEYWIDLFLYGKSMLLEIASLLLIFILVVALRKKKGVSFSKENILLISFVMFVVLSAVFSKFPKESFQGSIEQYESIWVLLSYVIVAVFSYHYVQEEKNRTLLIGALMFGLTVSCLIGVFQFFQIDFWDSDMGKNILIPEAFSGLRESLRFAEDYRGIGRVYMALYNPTYAGIYLVMLLPFLLLIKNRFLKVLLLPALLCLVGTLSKSAWVTAMFLFFLGGWMMAPVAWKERIEKHRKIIAVIIVCGIAALCGIILSKNAVLTEGKRLQEISAEEEHIRVVYKGNTLYLSEFPKDDSVTYKIVDENGEEPMLLWVPERGEIDSQDPRFHDLHFKVYLKDGIGYIYLKYADVVFRFTDQLGTGKYEYISINGKPDELKDAKVLFQSGDSLLNGRGYIWNRAVPVMFDNILWGTGPDTFLQVFPQDDYVARANLGYGFFTEILTNAHSFYVQLGLQNGMIALASLLSLLIIYLKKTWKVYADKKDYSQDDRVAIACFLGCIGYLICGLTFASSVCTTPIFAILIGMGLGMHKSSEESVCSIKK